MQHVVVHHRHARELHLIVLKAHFFGEVSAYAVQQCLPAQVRGSLQNADTEAGLVMLFADVGGQKNVLQTVRHRRGDERQFQGIQGLATVNLGKDVQGGVDGHDLAGLWQAVQVVVNLTQAVHLLIGEPGVPVFLGTLAVLHKRIAITGKGVAAGFAFGWFLVCDYHIQWGRASQTVINGDHALVDFGAGLEVVDEAVFHRQAV